MAALPEEGPDSVDRWLRPSALGIVWGGSRSKRLFIMAGWSATRCAGPGSEPFGVAEGRPQTGVGECQAVIQKGVGSRARCH